MDSQSSKRITEFDSGRRKMSSQSTFRGYADLALVAVLTLATVGIAFAFGEQGGPSWLRVPLGFVFVFLLPGYALTAALFPRTTVGPGRSFSFSVGGVERLVLSIGLSLAVVPLISITLTLLSFSIGVYSVIASLGLFIAVSLLIAAVRTYRSPLQDRFSPFPGGLRSLDRRTVTMNKVNVIFAIALLLAGAGLGAAIIGSDNGDSYTELAIQAPDEDGELVTDQYPDSLSMDEPEPLHVQIENHEHRSVDYTVVVMLEEVESDEVVDRTELDRFDVALDHTERTELEHELEPARAGESLRVSYLLYADTVPDQPTLSNADRSVHFFTDVTEDS